MNPSHAEYLPRLTTRQTDQDTQDSICLFHQTKKTFPTHSYDDPSDQNVKFVSNALSGNEKNYGKAPFLINGAKAV